MRAETYVLISDHLQWISNISMSDSVSPERFFSDLSKEDSHTFTSPTPR